jgi:hypothetical protein
VKVLKSKKKVTSLQVKVKFKFFTSLHVEVPESLLKYCNEVFLLRYRPTLSPRTVFAGLTAKRQRKAAVPSENPCVTEVDNYLEDPSSELSSLFKYPNILKLYVKLNTGLPASAAVERLFFWVAEFSH